MKKLMLIASLAFFADGLLVKVETRDLMPPVLPSTDF